MQRAPQWGADVAIEVGEIAAAVLFLSMRIERQLAIPGIALDGKLEVTREAFFTEHCFHLPRRRVIPKAKHRRPVATKRAALAAHRIGGLGISRVERLDGVAAQFAQRLTHRGAAGFFGAEEDEAVAMRDQHEVGFAR